MAIFRTVARSAGATWKPRNLDLVPHDCPCIDMNDIENHVMIKTSDQLRQHLFSRLDDAAGFWLQQNINRPAQRNPFSSSLTSRLQHYGLDRDGERGASLRCPPSGSSETTGLRAGLHEILLYNNSETLPRRPAASGGSVSL